MDAETMRRLAGIEQRLRGLPSRWAGGGVITPRRMVWIIGGNALATGHESIQYAASVTPGAVYDPDVDTVYPAGLGNGWLFVDGVQQLNRVLVRHDFTGYTQPLLAGRIMGVRGTVTLYYPSDPDGPMTAYTLDLP
jgi:hypothetical protein